MRSSIQVLAPVFMALAIGCAQEDMTTTDNRNDTTTADRATGSSTSPEVPMTYGDGVPSATAPATPDTAGSQTVTAAKVAEETREALETTGDFIAQNKDELVDEVQQELQVVNVKLDEMESQAKTLSAEARAEWDEQWQTVTEKRDALRTKLDELSTSSDDAWEELRDGTQQAWNEFELAIEKAADQFDHGAVQPESATDVNNETGAPN